VAGTGGLTMTAVTNGAVVTYTINSGAGTFTNAVIEGLDYTNAFTIAAGTNIAINLAGGTNTIDLDIDEDVNMNAQDITSLGTSNVTISSGSYGGVEGFKITSGTNNYWLLLQEATGDPFSSLTIEGVEYTTTATINAGSNVTIRTSGGAAFIDGVAAESTFGTVTNLNIEGSNYTASAILYAGSNVAIRTEGGTNFIDSTSASTDSNAVVAAGSNITVTPTTNGTVVTYSVAGTVVDTNTALDNRTATNNVNMGGFSITNVATNSIVFTDGATISSAKVSTWDAKASEVVQTPVDSRSATNDIEMDVYNVQWTDVQTLSEASSATVNLSTNTGGATGYPQDSPYYVGNLFDGLYTLAGSYSPDEGDSPYWWFMYDFGAGSNTIVSKYMLYGYSHPSTLAMDSWILKGSTNATDWTVLDSQTNQGPYLIDSGIVTQTFDNAVAYRYYLFTNITDYTYADSFALFEVELYGADTPATYSTNTYYAINGMTNSFNIGTLFWDGSHATNTAGINAPATTNATGAQGDMAFDSDYLYICITNDQWRRVAITNW